MKPESQATRLLRYLRDVGQASSLEITYRLRIVNVTGRVSDLRAAGYRVECFHDDYGVARYRVVEPEPVQAALFFA